MTDGFYVDPADYPPLDEPEPTVTSTEPDARQRVVRTVVQVVVAVLVSIPAAWAALAAAGVTLAPEVTAWVIGIPAALTILISAAQNAYDARHTT